MATLSEEQLTDAVKQEAALRRVAVLVASGLSPSQVFDAVSAEAGAVLEAESAGIFRFYEDDGTVGVSVGRWGDRVDDFVSRRDGASPHRCGRDRGGRAHRPGGPGR